MQLTEAELEEEKRKDFRNVVAVQVGILVTSWLCEDVLRLIGLRRPEEITWWLFQGLAGVYLYLLWDLLRNFTLRTGLVRTVGWLLVTLFLVGTLANNVLPQTAGLTRLNIVLHFFVLGVEMLVMRLSLRDLLRRNRHTVDKLWASAGIYFMAGLAFGNLFHLLHMVDGQTSHTDYFESLALSFTCLTGADNAFPMSHVIRNLGLLEATLGQLYLVLLISRVLLPREEL